VAMWLPTAEYVENANVTRLGRAHGLASIAELRARSVADIGWYWDAVVKDLELPFREPYTEVVDLSAGIEHADWFVGGELNIADACLERWRDSDRTAVVHEAEDGTVRTLTYRELAGQVDRVSAGLAGLGIGRGDAVALFLPMIPEAVIACYAIARLGAVLVPLFSGFAPTAIAPRLQDADAKAVVVADGTLRRGRKVAMKPLLDEALNACPTVRHVIVVGNVGADPAADGARDTLWSDLLAARGGARRAESMRATDTLLLAYTSGTTGRPKGPSTRTPVSW
jgi:acetyl-CoA synthetase